MEESAIALRRKAEQLAEKGELAEACRLCDCIVEKYPEDGKEALRWKAEQEYHNGYKKEALWDYICLYQLEHNKALFTYILELYYEPYRIQREINYRANLELLKEYPHYCSTAVSETELENYLLWQDDELILFADQEGNIDGFNFTPAQVTATLEEQVLMVVNELWYSNLELLDHATRLKQPFMDAENPLYAAYDSNKWQVLLQETDIKPLLEKDRIVFLIGTKSCEAYLKLTGVKPPMFCIGKDISPYAEIMERSFEEKMASFVENTRIVREYYKTNSDRILENIKSGRPSILFSTSRFTTALQYHVRDCSQAAEMIGCRTEILKEKTRLEGFFNYDTIKRIKDFQPDIIFLMNHFRYEWEDVVPPECIVVTWIQDPMAHIMNPETPKRLGKNDFILNHFTDWEEFRSLGYDKYARVMEAPVPVNDSVYKKYPLSLQEQKLYGADIALVCHASDIEGGINELCKTIKNEKLVDLIRALVYDYYENALKTGNFLYSLGEFKAYVKAFFARYSGGNNISGNSIEWLAKELLLKFNQRIFRNVLVDWLLEAGYTNLKLWGNGWTENKKYKPYAMGPAENGETLSKIYQCSKINLGNNIMTTATARVWECMLSRAFYMSNYIPQEYDITDIRRILKLNEDVVCFHNKEDLLKKVDYYLTHEHERQELIDRGQKIALEKMTYKSLMKKMLDEIANKL